jgi:hypothetical protein
MVMSIVEDPNETANKPAILPSPSSEQPTVSPPPEDRVSALFQEISAAVRQLADRMDVLEERLGGDERDASQTNGAGARSDAEPAELLTEAFAAHGIPPVALRCDGRVLLSTADLAHVDLSSRERWEGVLLNEAEAYDVLDQLGFEEAAAKTAGRIITLARNAKKEGGNDE